MQQLQPYFIAGALIQVIADTLGGDLPRFNDFIKSPEDGICALLPIGAQKILPHVIKLPLAHLPVGLDHDGTQGKQVQFKIGRGNLLPGSISEYGTGTSRAVYIVDKTPQQESYNGPRKPKYKVAQDCCKPFDHKNLKILAKIEQTL
jgi:hypothetical protein